MSASTKLITYEDSLAMPENKLEEIVHGESRIMPPASPNHSDLLDALSDILKGQLDRREYAVKVSAASLGIERSPLTYRVPDLMVFRQEARRQDRARTAESDPYIWAVPELIVECLSPSNRKGPMRELLADYAQIAVPELWLLDPALPQFASYRFESGSLCHWETKRDGPVTPLLLANVTVDLAELWAAFKGTI